MNRSLRRSGLALVALLLALAALAPAALAGSSMPAANPSDFGSLVKDGTANVYTKTITPAMLGGATAQSWTYGGGMTNGGGAITLSKMRTSGFDGSRTITVQSLAAPEIITGNVALSGGAFGSTVIRSTTLAKNGKTWTIVLGFPGEQGTPPKVTIKFYTYTNPAPVS